ncbi:MAG: sensor histidine kinase [Solirubrobacteraceae bacterium]
MTLASVGVESQRRFLAYAAHELRGEVALQRTLAEVALADVDADRAALRKMGERIVVACERQERLLAALLTLSQAGSGSLRREPVDLAATAAEVLLAQDHHDLESTASLEPALTTADPHLVERLVANLVANAVRHNVPGGRFDIATHTATGHAIFTIANTGPPIPGDELPRLFQPFQRLGARAGSSNDGVGLGLAIVHAIASAHHASVTAYSRMSSGGLGIDVAFPALN